MPAESKTLESDPDESLEQRIGSSLTRLNGVLNQAHLWPLKRKVYKVVESRLRELRAALLEKGPKSVVSEATESRIHDILTSLQPDLPEVAAWDIADSLKEILPIVAPDSYLYTALLEEKARNNGDSHLWSCLFGSGSLDSLLEAYESDPDSFPKALIASRLSSVYRIRNGLGLHDRAREGMRTAYLRRIAWILGLAILLVILSSAVWFADSVLLLIISAVAGATGAIMSRAMRLRDLAHIIELRSTWDTLFSQAIFGSALAVIVILILQSKIIIIAGLELDGLNLANPFVIGFISGFSEPFALGLLDKISAMGSRSPTTD